ncbi:hypothetical protein CVT26_006753 [Gymnopilus dilepis]|uniref:Uncharacterized protein n=1 Tax=Gymnopilus dilepis TaxID=231916 RepID=A0A409W1Q3_9AGAR|nr:hypothetical protein CVT26_006753 [Gymnopilus dilepis]
MTRQWFKERQYTLYKQVSNEYGEITSWVEPSNCNRIFCETMMSELTETQLQQPPYEQDTYSYVERPPFNSVEKWAAFKEPPIPGTALLLRKICNYTWSFRTVDCIRWLFSVFWTIPHRMVTYFVGLRAR